MVFTGQNEGSLFSALVNRRCCFFFVSTDGLKLKVLMFFFGVKVSAPKLAASDCSSGGGPEVEIGVNIFDMMMTS